MPFSRGSYRPRDQTCFSLQLLHCRQILYTEPLGSPPPQDLEMLINLLKLHRFLNHQIPHFLPPKLGLDNNSGGSVETD